MLALLAAWTAGNLAWTLLLLRWRRRLVRWARMLLLVRGPLMTRQPPQAGACGPASPSDGG